MKLSELLRHIPSSVLLDPGDPEITGVGCDSRTIGPGELFAAVRGARADGHDHVLAAARAGAPACLVEREGTGFDMVRVLVPNAEAALGRAACALARHPSRALQLVGVTGTNGKTTTAYLLQHILTSAGVTAGRLGTVSYAYPSGEEPAPLTTPDAPGLQRSLARMVREGARAAVMEVSSHALVRQRVEGCSFACAVFTNLSQDHLDFHGSMESYYQAKRRLFTHYAPQAPAVTNAEDPFGERLARELGDRAVTFGLSRGTIRLEVEELKGSSMRGVVHHPGGATPMQAPLAGAFNAQNAACALAAAWTLGLDMDAAVDALSQAPRVPGRLEAVENSLGLAVYVDYAHTPDALDRVLASVRGFTRGRLLCLFGCGGDRDRGKRPLMARAAARWCDALVLTADNSRSEPTEAILDEIEAGLPDGWEPACSAEALSARARRYARVPDRAAAIRCAVASVRQGDALVVAGKGHETTQTAGGRVLPFDDCSEVRAALAEKAAA